MKFQVGQVWQTDRDRTAKIIKIMNNRFSYPIVAEMDGGAGTECFDSEGEHCMSHLPSNVGKLTMLEGL